MEDTPTRSNRVWTVPNLLSMARLAGVPVFLWLVLGPEADGWALALLMLSGVTDWLDGYLARRLNQISQLGQILDPVADRLYILAVVIGLGLREIIPWWVAVILPLRDVLLWGLVPLLRTRGYSALPVHFLGKAATFNLLYAFPLLLLGDGDGVVATLAKVFGWAFAWWGIGLYWWAGVLYAYQVFKLMRTTERWQPLHATVIRPTCRARCAAMPDRFAAARCRPPHPGRPARPGGDAAARPHRAPVARRGLPGRGSAQGCSRRGRPPASPRAGTARAAAASGRPRQVAAAVMGVFGVLVAIAAVQTARNAPEANASRASLVEQVLARRDTVARLQERLERLRSSTIALRSDAWPTRPRTNRRWRPASSGWRCAPGSRQSPGPVSASLSTTRPTAT